MRQKLRNMFLIGIGLLLMIPTVGWGAAPNPQQIRHDNTEMRQSIVWLMEGLMGLARENDKGLALQAAQKKKILPFFNALVQEKILLLEIPPREQANNRFSGGSGGRISFDPNDPEVQARLKRLQEQTAFGNKQADAIDHILTRKQVSFIDNLDFKAEKYGFVDFRAMLPGGGPGQGQNQGQGQFQRPDPQVIAKIRQVLQNGRANLVKLCNEVQKMLHN